MKRILSVSVVVASAAVLMLFFACGSQSSDKVLVVKVEKADGGAEFFMVDHTEKTAIESFKKAVSDGALSIYSAEQEATEAENRPCGCRAKFNEPGSNETCECAKYTCMCVSAPRP